MKSSPDCSGRLSASSSLGSDMDTGDTQFPHQQLVFFDSLKNQSQCLFSHTPRTKSTAITGGTLNSQAVRDSSKLVRCKSDYPYSYCSGAIDTASLEDEITEDTDGLLPVWLHHRYSRLSPRAIPRRSLHIKPLRGSEPVASSALPASPPEGSLAVSSVHSSHHRPFRDALSDLFWRDPESTKSFQELERRSKRNAGLTGKERMRARTIQQKFLLSAYRLGNRLNECEMEVPAPDDFAAPSIQHIRQSLLKNRSTCGSGTVNLPATHFDENLSEFARRRGLSEKTMDRWIHHGVRCWVAFYVRLMDPTISTSRPGPRHESSDEEVDSTSSLGTNTRFRRGRKTTPLSNQDTTDSSKGKRRMFRGLSHRRHPVTGIPCQEPGTSLSLLGSRALSSSIISDSDPYPCLPTTTFSTGGVRYQCQAAHSSDIPLAADPERESTRRRLLSIGTRSNRGHDDGTIPLPSHTTSNHRVSTLALDDPAHLPHTDCKTHQRHNHTCIWTPSTDHAYETATAVTPLPRPSPDFLSCAPCPVYIPPFRKHQRLECCCLFLPKQTVTAATRPIQALEPRACTNDACNVSTSATTPSEDGSFFNGRQISSDLLLPGRSSSSLEPNFLNERTSSTFPLVPDCFSDTNSRPLVTRPETSMELEQMNVDLDEHQFCVASEPQQQQLKEEGSDSVLLCEGPRNGSTARNRHEVVMTNRSTGETTKEGSYCVERGGGSMKREDDKEEDHQNPSEVAKADGERCGAGTTTISDNGYDRASDNGQGDAEFTSGLAAIREVYRTSKEIRGGARRWDEWGQCWVCRRYSIVLHCAAAAILLSLDPTCQKEKRQSKEGLKQRQQSGLLSTEKFMMNGKSVSTIKGPGDSRSTVKALKLQALDSIQRVVHLKTFANRCDVIGGLACVGMAIAMANRREGAKKSVADEDHLASGKKRRPWRWSATGCFSRLNRTPTPITDPSLKHASVSKTAEAPTVTQHVRPNIRRVTAPNQLEQTSDSQAFTRPTLSSYGHQLTATRDLGEPEKADVENSFCVAADNLLPRFDDRSDRRGKRTRAGSRKSYRHILILKFHGVLKNCLVTVFDSLEDCEEFVQMINMLRDFRNNV